MVINPEIFGASIIAIGDFNPAIFSPNWLLSNQLIGEADAETALLDEGLHISHQLARYKTEWFQLQVVGNQFSLTSIGPVTPAIKDLAVSIFSLLSHTPVTAVGLNFTGHYKIISEEDYHKIGDMLAPKLVWENAFIGEEKLSFGLDNLTIRIEKCSRGEEPVTKDLKRVTLQPSNKIKQGIFFTLNNHFDTTLIRSDESAARLAVSIINDNWDNELSTSTDIFGSLINSTLR